ncbi:MAG TPA: hypothetical protein VMC42_04165 [Methanoregulaceae archaeon]|nr:hypothetical protein [Methanoregulaceae archaeon]
MATLVRRDEMREIVDRIITGSGRSLSLASRDLTLPASLIQRVRSGDGLPDIRLYYGDRFIVGDPSEIAILKECPHIRVFVCELLRTNLFMNESSGIITSYNLLESPGRSPFDLGVSFSETADEKMFASACDAIAAIEAESRLQTNFSDSQRKSGPTGRPDEREEERAAPGGTGFLTRFFHEALGGGGYCITCGSPMDYRRTAPFCTHCQNRQKGQPVLDSNGFYCHNCGTAAHVTRKVPFCSRCLSDRF